MVLTFRTLILKLALLHEKTPCIILVDVVQMFPRLQRPCEMGSVLPMEHMITRRPLVARTGRTIVMVVSRRLPTAEAQVRAQVRLYWIYGRPYHSVKWHWGRPPSTPVSLANSQFADCTTVIIIFIYHPRMAQYDKQWQVYKVDSVAHHSKKKRQINQLSCTDTSHRKSHDWSCGTKAVVKQMISHDIGIIPSDGPCIHAITRERQVFLQAIVLYGRNFHLL
jgi:hypothetical protein